MINRGYDPHREEEFFALFSRYFDLERDVSKQHDSHNYSLERMLPLAAAAGHPEKSLKVIHVAGTKGKGSTCFYIDALLRSAGKHSGVFSSPHLSTVRERFLLDGKPADYDLLIEQGREFCQELNKLDLHPSLFEIFTVLTLKIMVASGMEWAVFETGIGGRVDATNYVPTKAATVITPLSYDHTALLGDTIEAIAGEKAGIIRSGVPVILARQPYAAAAATVRCYANEAPAPVIDAISPEVSQDWLPEKTPLYLRENFATAFTTVQQLGVVPDKGAFCQPVMPARFELLQSTPPVIIDAAHNGDSIRRLVQAINHAYPGVRFTCILGALPGKDIHRMVEELRSFNGDFILVNPDTPRGSALPQLEESCRQAGLAVKAVIPTLTSKEQLPAGTPLLFTGSFFTALTGEKLFNPAH